MGNFRNSKLPFSIDEALEKFKIHILQTERYYTPNYVLRILKETLQNPDLVMRDYMARRWYRRFVRFVAEQYGIAVLTAAIPVPGTYKEVLKHIFNNRNFKAHRSKFGIRYIKIRRLRETLKLPPITIFYIIRDLEFMKYITLTEEIERAKGTIYKVTEGVLG